MGVREPRGKNQRLAAKLTGIFGQSRKTATSAVYHDVSWPVNSRA